MQAVGSNAVGQLGIGHTEDVAEWTACIAEGSARGAFLRDGWRTVNVVHTKSSTMAWCTNGTAQRLYVAGKPPMASGVRTTFVLLPLSILFDAAGVAHGEVVHVAAGWDCFYVALRTPRTDCLLAWGEHNTFGQLGDQAGKNGWHQILWDHEAAPLWPSHGPLRGSVRIRALAAGVRHCMAFVVREGPSVHAGLIGWGDARHGQLGPVPAAVSVHGVRRRLRSPCLLFSWACDAEAKLALGMHHSVVCLRTDPAWTSVWVLGSNKHGQAKLNACVPPGVPTRTSSAPAGVHALDVHTSAIPLPACHWHTTLLWWPAHHVLGGCGATQYQQLAGCGNWPDSRFTLSAGSEHCVAVYDTHLYAWGWNEHGNVGGDASSLGVTRLFPAQRAYAGHATSFVEIGSPTTD